MSKWNLIIAALCIATILAVVPSVKAAPIHIDLSSHFNEDAVINVDANDSSQVEGLDYDGSNKEGIATQSAGELLFGTPFSGLPDNGVFTAENTDLNFDVVLGYGGAGNGYNAVRLDAAGDSATVDLASVEQGKYEQLYFFGYDTSGNANIALDYELTYDDTSTTSGSIDPFPAWDYDDLDDGVDDGEDLAYLIDGLDQVQDKGTNFHNRDNDDNAIFAFDLSADADKTLTSIQFSKPGSNGNVMIMGVSGTLVPEPATMALIALGGLGLLKRRR